MRAQEALASHPRARALLSHSGTSEALDEYLGWSGRAKACTRPPFCGGYAVCRSNLGAKVDTCQRPVWASIGSDTFGAGLLPRAFGWAPSTSTQNSPSQAAHRYSSSTTTQREMMTCSAGAVWSLWQTGQ